MKRVEWSELCVREMLATNSFTYQNVPLPHGLSTGGECRSKTAELIFPDDMSGRSMIDVGCMYGYFCFAAEDRGATDCLGLDIDRENVRKSRILGDCKGSSSRFEHFDLEHDDIPDQHDYVLCLNLLHHLRNPIAALDKLIDATREKLILEVASFAPRDRKKNRVSFLMSWFLSGLPILYTACDYKKAHSITQTFYITKNAMKAMLLVHRASIASVELIDSGHRGRYIVIAEKRRIGHLFIVAGLQASGKSTLIGELTERRSTALAQQLGFDASAPWRTHHFGKFTESSGAAEPCMLVHYNINRPSRYIADLIRVADKTTIVTVMCSSEQLLRQYREGRTHDVWKKLTSPRHRKKIRKMQNLFQDSAALGEVYREWFDFVKQQRDSGVIVTYDGAYKVQSIDTWESLQN
jgi:SAM-dependent methyltransferase